MPSTITINTPPVTLPVSSATGSAAPASVTAPGVPIDTYLDAIHQVFIGASQAVAGPLGLPAPQRPEDAALLLEEVQTALDQTTVQSNNQSLASRLAAARQSLHTTAAAIASASDALQAATGQKATDTASLATATTSQNALRATIATLDQIDELNTQIAAAQQSGDSAAVASLTAQRDAATAGLGSPVPVRGDIEDQLSAVTATMGSLNSAISRDDDAIDAADQALEGANVVLTSVFSQLALTVQTGNGAIQLNAATSAQRDIGFDNVTDTLDQQRAKDVSRAVSDAANTDLVRKTGDKSRDAAELATTLWEGLQEAVAVLRQEAAAPSQPSSVQALVQQDNRIRLSL